LKHFGRFLVAIETRSEPKMEIVEELFGGGLNQDEGIYFLYLVLV